MNLPIQDVPAFDCRRCGACCADLDVLLTDAEANDFERKPGLVALTYLYRMPGSPPVRFLQRDAATGRCVALAGPLHDCGCTIYDERPHLCRAFDAGSPDCLASRARLGIANPEA